MGLDDDFNPRRLERYLALVQGGGWVMLELPEWLLAMAYAVLGWTVGEPVCALLSGGGYAEYATAPAGHVLALPNRLNLMEGACLPEAAATTTMALVLEAGLAHELDGAVTLDYQRGGLVCRMRFGASPRIHAPA